MRWYMILRKMSASPCLWYGCIYIHMSISFHLRKRGIALPNWEVECVDKPWEVAVKEGKDAANAGDRLCASDRQHTLCLRGAHLESEKLTSIHRNSALDVKSSVQHQDWRLGAVAGGWHLQSQPEYLNETKCSGLQLGDRTQFPGPHSYVLFKGRLVCFGHLLCHRTQTFSTHSRIKMPSLCSRDWHFHNVMTWFQ